MDRLAQQVSRYDRDVAEFLTELGAYLQHYRGPALGDAIEQIAQQMGMEGRCLVQELARSLQTSP